jgi:asparagine N-glycosylation enzyme membrane subunit Stt3
MKILNSASKIVFILLAVSACAGFFLKLLEPKDFMLLAGMAFSFYFAAKPIDANGNITK